MGNLANEYQAPIGAPAAQQHPANTYYPEQTYGEPTFVPQQHQQDASYYAPPQQHDSAPVYADKPTYPETSPPNHAQTKEQQQHVSSGKLSAWEKTKKGGKQGFDQLWNLGMKLGVPVNKITNKLGSEAFWPATMDKESDKAARILKSFCKDGFYAEQPKSEKPIDGPKHKPKVLVKIPQKVIQNAVGLAIFTTWRSGMWVSGAGGSGVLIARLPDGSWSPPSGILIHTLGVGAMVGIDIYDCVLVINSYEALKAFSSVRVTLGTEVSVVAGPVGAGGILESDVRPDQYSKGKANAQQDKVVTDAVQTEIQQQAEKERRTRKPIFTYQKSRGLYAGIQVDGTFIVERRDENAKFYGERLGVQQILRGEVKNVPHATRMLMEVVKAAEGRPADAAMIDAAATVPPPSDFEIEKSQEASHGQNVVVATDAESQRQFDSITQQKDNFPAYNPNDYEHADSDAAMAARLQQEEYTRSHNAANDIPPPQPARPTEKSAAFTNPQAAYTAGPSSGSDTLPAYQEAAMGSTGEGYGADRKEHAAPTYK